MGGLGGEGTPSPHCKKCFWRIFGGLPLCGEKPTKQYLTRFLCECSFTPQVFENAEKLLMLQRKVKGWFESDIGMKLILRGWLLTTGYRVILVWWRKGAAATRLVVLRFSVLFAIFSVLYATYVPCTVSCVKEKGPHSPQGLWADNVGCGLGLGFPVRAEPGIWFHLVSPRPQILQNQEKMQHRKGKYS